MRVDFYNVGSDVYKLNSNYAACAEAYIIRIMPYDLEHAAVLTQLGYHAAAVLGFLVALRLDIKVVLPCRLLYRAVADDLHVKAVRAG